MHRWQILGSGAIGTLVAHLLTHAGYSPTLIRKPGAPGISRIKPFSGAETEVEFSYDNLDSSEPIDQLLVCTKAQHAVAAVKSVSHRLNANALVILLHNGMGPQQDIARQFPQWDVLWGSVTHGAYIDPGSQNLVHAGQGEIFVGRPAINRRDEQLALPSIFTQVRDIEMRLWQKLAINCLINPLTVKYDCLNGELLNIPEASLDMARLAAELENLAQHMGVDLNQTLTLAEKVAEQTANNRSSMLQDVTLKRPNEIDFITGFVVQTGERLHLDVGHHQALWQLVKDKSRVL